VTSHGIAVLQTVSATAAGVSAIFFLRFWRESRELLFALFSVALWLLAASWILLACFNPVGEAQGYVYGIRLLAFLFIIVAIVQKNRQQR
jgi:hypothetical protein